MAWNGRRQPALLPIFEEGLKLGQAKSRGNRDQRVAAALGLQERSLDDIKVQLGLPADAVFLGYGVHIKASDEFLARFDQVGKAWSKDPQLAIAYDGFADAHEVSRQCRESVVVGMFDLGDQIYVAEIRTKPTTAG